MSDFKHPYAETAYAPKSDSLVGYMEKKMTALEPGLRVRVAGLSDPPEVAPSLLATRRSGVVGEVIGEAAAIPGVWYVRHEDGSEAAYRAHELEDAPAGKRPFRKRKV